ncbi:MAG TPA: hypothetical protein VKQ30_05305, partial [Ktedonobacterales bacterium]|nr:hypothetical protein [Ktedonobacterales bacterium]
PSTPSMMWKSNANLGTRPRYFAKCDSNTGARLLLEKEVHPKIVQELLGHSTITLTLNTYSHVIPAMHAAVADHMDALFTNADSVENEPAQGGTLS